MHQITIDLDRVFAELEWAAQRGIAGIGFGLLFVAGSYPWLLPGWLNVVVAAGVGIWGAFTGLVGMSRSGVR